MIKILFAIDGLRSGGKERRFLSLLKSLIVLEDFKCEVIVFNKEVHYKELFDLGVSVNFLIRTTKKDISLFFKYHNIAKIFNPNIIHSWDTLSTLYSIPTAKLLRKKLITSKITDAPPNYTVFSKFWVLSEICFHFSDIILANSSAGLKSYRIKSQKSQVIYNGVDLSRFSVIFTKEEIKNELRISTKFIVIMVASFSDNKDYNTFFEIAHHINKVRNDVSFVAVGDGKKFNICRQKVDALQLKNVIFLGQRNDVEQILKASDIGVLISNLEVHGEGISNSILEYMAMSLPVIANNAGGTNEIIQDNFNGFLVNDNQIQNFISHINNLLNDDELRKQIGENAKKTIETNFDLDKMSNNFIETYKQTLIRI